MLKEEGKIHQSKLQDCNLEQNEGGQKQHFYKTEVSQSMSLKWKEWAPR